MTKSDDSKCNEKNKQTWNSIRISSGTKNAADKILKSANNKKAGRKLKLDEILNFSINLLEPEHIKKLQSNSLSNADHKELMRQYYTETRGKISKDDFIGFLMGNDFADFKVEYLDKQKSE